MAKRPTSLPEKRSKVDAEFEATFDAIFKGPQIGAGSFSKIYLGRYFGDVVAIKEQVRDQAEMDEYLRREISILKEVSHPNILSFCGSTERVDANGRFCLYILTEYAQAGDMLQLFLSDQPLGWRFRCKLMREAANGLEFLHSKNLIHRDIKGENFLLTKDWHVKVSDLGMARPLIESSSTTMTICGTDEYMAPELMFDEAYHNPVDVYALGMVMFEAMKRKKIGTDGFLVRSPADNFAFDEDATRAEVPDDTPKSLLLLAIECLSYNDYERPASEDVAAWLEDLILELPEDNELQPTVKDMPHLPPPSPPPSALAEYEYVNSGTKSMILASDTGKSRSMSCGDVIERAIPAVDLSPPANSNRGTFDSSSSTIDAQGRGETTGEEDDDFLALPGIMSRPATVSGGKPSRPSMMKRAGSMMSKAGRQALDSFSPSRRSIMLKVPNSPENDDSFSGVLFKRGLVNLLGWRRRYFVLCDGTLYWFASQQEYERSPEALGKVDLTPDTLIKDCGSLRFQIANPECTDTRENFREFAAVDAESYDLWVVHLRQSVEILKHPTGGSSPTRRQSNIKIRARFPSTDTSSDNASASLLHGNVSEWLASLELKDELFDKFVTANYMNIRHIYEFGLTNEDLDIIGIDRPQARNVIQMACKGGFAPCLRLNVRSYRDAGDIIIYEVVGAWRFFRSSRFLSYADFMKLHQKVKYIKRRAIRSSTSTEKEPTQHSKLPALPSHRVSVFQNMRSTSFLQQRRIELDQYISQISQMAKEEGSSENGAKATFQYLIHFFHLDVHT